MRSVDDDNRFGGEVLQNMALVKRDDRREIVGNTTSVRLLNVFPGRLGRRRTPRERLPRREHRLNRLRIKRSHSDLPGAKPNA